MTLHPIQRRYYAEDLFRVRGPDEQRRYVASQRSARIDPNPHQIDAVMFALRKIPDGGCILADEVGLGKTIEAGLVISQLLAEGKQRILLITPKALLGQWKQELFGLFNITADEIGRSPEELSARVLLTTRDFAGSDQGVSVLRGYSPFDLCVIDEAHEMFSGLYKRYNKFGVEKVDARDGKIASRVKHLLVGTPVLLLTATPIQNTLTELWGLAQYVEPTGTLLGQLPTFKRLFCGPDDRTLAEGQEHELRRRLEEICKRTLRRQAQEFMDKPFVGRRTQLVPYRMSAEEQQLYEDVTRYLLEPHLCAFRGRQRQLLLIGFHRRMASSVPALAASLERVAERLRKMQSKASDDETETAAEMLNDLEEEAESEAEEAVPDGVTELCSAEAIQRELDRVLAYVARARALSSDAKAHALVTTIRTVLDRAKEGEGSGKVVVFTESITTQEYLRRVLRESGIVTDGDITLFRGNNDSPRATEALKRWTEEEMAHLPRTAHPSPDIAVRLALVHEFRTRSKVLISTEAGAKGLNLQFAGTLINYDLPWNPQRIEQRIGRIHRYGQTRDVLIINFAAEGNAAQRLTLEILMKKLDLFGTVLGASDEILHEPSTDATETLAGAVGADFEKRLKRIYERARTVDEIEQELIELRESIAEERARFEAMHERTAGLISERLDEKVRRVFRKLADELPNTLRDFDFDVHRVVVAYLDAIGVKYRQGDISAGIQLEVEASPAIGVPDLTEGFVAYIGDARLATDAEPLHLGHPLVQAALDEAREATQGVQLVRIEAPADIEPGRRGALRLLKVRHRGFHVIEELIPVVLLEGEENPLPSAQGKQLVCAPMTASEGFSAPFDEDAVEDAADELLFDMTSRFSTATQASFARTLEQIETSMEDRILLEEQRRQLALDRLARAEASRDSAIGAEARTTAEAHLKSCEEELSSIEREIERLRAREDADYNNWLSQAHARRAQAPEVTVLLDAQFILVESQ